MVAMIDLTLTILSIIFRNVSIQAVHRIVSDVAPEITPTESINGYRETFCNAASRVPTPTPPSAIVPKTTIPCSSEPCNRGEALNTQCRSAIVSLVSLTPVSTTSRIAILAMYVFDQNGTLKRATAKSSLYISFHRPPRSYRHHTFDPVTFVHYTFLFNS